MNSLVVTLKKLPRRYRRILLISASLIAIYGIGLGLVAPRVIQSQVQNIVQQRLGLNLTIEKISINPFTFKVRIDQFALSHTSREPLIGFASFSIDFEAVSLFNQAWTLDHIKLSGLHGQFERFSEIDNTLNRLAQQWEATATEPNTAPPPAEPSALPRFLIRNIDVQLSQLDITDQVPATPFNHTIGPLDIHIDALSTLPEQSGLHTIALKGQSGIAVTWQGSIHLSPITSKGHINIQGPYPVIASDYLQDSLIVAIDSGFFNADLDYSLTQSPHNSANPFSVLLNNIHVSLDDLSLIERGSKKPLYRLQKFALSDASVQWPKQIIDAPKIALDNGQLWLSRDKEGKTNIERLLAAQQFAFEPSSAQAAVTKPTSTQPQTGQPHSDKQKHQINTPSPSSVPATANAAPVDTPWTISNSRFELNNWAVQIDDAATPSAPTERINNIDVAINDFQLKDHHSIHFEYGLELLSGRIDGEGHVIPMPFSALNTTTKIQKLMLSHLQPYAAQFAKIAIADGSLDATINVKSDESQEQQNFMIDSELSINQLKILEANQNKTLLAWDLLALQALETSATGNALAVQKIILNKPYIDFKINQDGTTSIEHLLINQASDSTVETQAPSTETSAELKENSLPYHIKMGSFAINNGSSNFADESLPLPFMTKIHNLNGGISTLDNHSKASTDIKLEGQLDEYGLLNIEGILTPFALEENSNISLKFENINVPNFTPYAIKFAGRKITDGRLDLNLNYTLNNGALQGSNSIILRTFNLGESVEQPGALDLPLDLAIGLLKDNDKKITLDLPIAGDINNPSFSVASVLGQALKKILSSAISSPFRLLSGLVGGNSEAFGKVNFTPGASHISPPEQEKLHKLAQAMKARPKLLLKVPKTSAEHLDIPALQEQQFMHHAELALGYPIDSEALTAKKTVKFLESGFLKRKTSQDLKLFKQSFMTQEDNKSLDALAYTKALKQQLITQEAIANEQLTTLALDRAKAIQSVIVEQGIDHQRVMLVEAKKTKRTKGEYVMANLGLDTKK
ncbi:DUF748 domain-containing protein [Marinagarivorans algicola]|uniref:DUF748 domain-containing protein n=1 Tax=Marinagarivorans algicola TaxID=1513270 RepID=UPI0006B89C91|nr:DUF748 domain-containing protein [Marinagarivorans algicola]